MKTKKISFPKTRLADLISRPGGIDRDEAVAVALKAVETMRDDCNVAIGQTIGTIESIVRAGKSRALGAADMQEVLTLADRLITLSGTYGYVQLDAVSRSLCDLVETLSRNGTYALEPIAVHTQALRLMAPGSALPPQEQIDGMLAMLAKVLAHFRGEQALIAEAVAKSA